MVSEGRSDQPALKKHSCENHLSWEAISPFRQVLTGKLTALAVSVSTTSKEQVIRPGTCVCVCVCVCVCACVRACARAAASDVSSASLSSSLFPCLVALLAKGKITRFLKLTEVVFPLHATTLTWLFSTMSYISQTCLHWSVYQYEFEYAEFRNMCVKYIDILKYTNIDCNHIA